MNLDMKQPASFLLWTVAVFVFAVVASIGWQFGEKIYAFF